LPIGSSEAIEGLARPTIGRTILASEQEVAVITGASQGIGASLVKGFREIGYGIVANWSRQWMQRAATTDRSASSLDESSPSNRIGENRCLKKSILIAAASSVQRL
jgi:NAD(P)-dependent dehydrogenase (short-subunit alcohol dehydrogenase family)